MPQPDLGLAGSSTIPSPAFLQELEDDKLRSLFVVSHMRTRLALQIRALREQRGWSQAELGRRVAKPQSVVSRLEDPDYGRLSLKTLYEVAAAFRLPLFIDMPEWGDWFRLTSDMSSSRLERRQFDLQCLLVASRTADGATSGEAGSARSLSSNVVHLEPARQKHRNHQRASGEADTEDRPTANGSGVASFRIPPCLRREERGADVRTVRA